MRKAVAFVPAHISGFFQPCHADTPERTGSRNCGPCLDAGVLTEVRIKPAGRTTIKISIDGKRAPEARTTMAAVKQLLRMKRRSFRIDVDHTCQVPVGAGYGASGAGALGVVLALSKALGLRLPRGELVAIAHVAEVTCRTGLGDVGAQAVGGLVIGVQPGAPPHGRWERMTTPKNLKVVCATLGPLSTSSLLKDEDFKRRAGEIGEFAMSRLMEQPTSERFVAVSKVFAEGLGLLDDELRGLIKAAEGAGAIGASQAMLGRAVFALAESKKAKRVEEAFLGVLSREQVIVSGLNNSGAELLQNV